MHAILTHEQADFDALASMLGAALLDEGAIPILPHRINRNVRAFLTIYSSELPYIELRDIPSEPVDSITLVDTQSLVTIKGMNEKTQVRTIDHHPLRPGLPPNWLARAEEVGADDNPLRGKNRGNLTFPLKYPGDHASPGNL